MAEESAACCRDNAFQRFGPWLHQVGLNEQVFFIELFPRLEPDDRHLEKALAQRPLWLGYYQVSIFDLFVQLSTSMP